MRGHLLTALAMLAFAGNSLLCRAALRDGAIDPASFTAIRIASGGVILLILAISRRSGRPVAGGNWISAVALFVYAAAFSFAYVRLDASSGALILFGLVQATMISHALTRGEGAGAQEWIGWLLAAAGITALVLPGAAAPGLAGALLMAAAGIAWGVYSLLGRGARDPLRATAGNFMRAAVLIPFLALPGIDEVSLSLPGVVLAIVSGAVTSGLGYVLWYAAVRGLTSLEAALVQLSVPAIAAAGGVLLLGEPLTLRLVASALLILGGISLALLRRRPDPR